eukprot:scaffold138427_cov66-Phaeocystis_antarctica.AAC.2
MPEQLEVPPEAAELAKGSTPLPSHHPGGERRRDCPGAAAAAAERGAARPLVRRPLLRRLAVARPGRRLPPLLPRAARTAACGRRGVQHVRRGGTQSLPRPVGRGLRSPLLLQPRVPTGAQGTSRRRAKCPDALDA